MKIPRDLSGRDLARALCKYWEYVEASQEGSHLLLVTKTPSHQRIAIPLHRPVKMGTLAGILRTVAAHKGTSRDAIIETL